MTIEEKIGQTNLRCTSSRVKESLPESLKEGGEKVKLARF